MESGPLTIVRENPSTYADWGKDWDVETNGKEDTLVTPYLEKPFNQEREEGLIPTNLIRIGDT
jgi:hypothetical protein